MTRRLTFSVVLSLVACFAVIAMQIRQAPAASQSNYESSTAYRYRTSQIVHWRAIALRH